MSTIALGLGITVLLLVLIKRQWFYWRILWMLESFDLRFGGPRNRLEEQEPAPVSPLYKTSGL